MTRTLQRLAQLLESAPSDSAVGPAGLAQCACNCTDGAGRIRGSLQIVPPGLTLESRRISTLLQQPLVEVEPLVNLRNLPLQLVDCL